MNSEELFNLIKSKTSFSNETIDYIISNTEIKLSPVFFISNNKSRSFIEIDEYLCTFLKQKSYRNILINNKEINNSDLLTKFKVGDSVWYFDRDLLKPINYLIVDIKHDFNEYEIRTEYLKDLSFIKANSEVGVKRICSDGSISDIKIYLSFTNDELFTSKKDLLQMLLNNFIEN